MRDAPERARTAACRLSIHARASSEDAHCSTSEVPRVQTETQFVHSCGTATSVVGASGRLPAGGSFGERRHSMRLESKETNLRFQFLSNEGAETACLTSQPCIRTGAAPATGAEVGRDI